MLTSAIYYEARFSFLKGQSVAEKAFTFKHLTFSVSTLDLCRSLHKTLRPFTCQETTHPRNRAKSKLIRALHHESDKSLSFLCQQLLVVNYMRNLCMES